MEEAAYRCDPAMSDPREWLHIFKNWTLKTGKDLIAFNDNRFPFAICSVCMPMADQLKHLLNLTCI